VQQPTRHVQYVRCYNRADIGLDPLGPRFGAAYQITTRPCCSSFSIAWLNGGAYEYGTSKLR